MGVYDVLPDGSQVKLWNCEMRTVNVGDSVPDFLCQSMWFCYVKVDLSV